MFLEQLLNGIILGSSYALVGIAFTLILGTLGLLNIAIGECFMLGAFFCLTLLHFGIPLFPTFLGSIVAAGLVSVLIERVAFRPLRYTSPLIPLLSSVGMSLLLQDVASNVWGVERLSFPRLLAQTGWTIGALAISATQAAILVTTIILVLILQFLIQRTRFGRAMRAVAENLEAASLLGVEPTPVIVGTFFISGALAGAAGILLALNFSLVDPFVGLQFGVKGVAVMVVGGMGSIYGAMLAGPLLGIAEVFSVALWGAVYRDVAVWGLLFLFLVVRPSGLLGTAYRARV